MIGVIADDLTGAAEIGAVGWRHGLRAEVVCSGPPSQETDVVCLDTDSRSATPDDAARRAAVAAESLQRAGVRWIYKKVDSVLRGHVVIELRAILRQLNCSSAILVPANPGRGRIVRKGQYLINETPINETEFGRDPEYPRQSAAVLDLLGQSRTGPIHVSDAHVDPPAEGIVVGEAESSADLQRWACRRSPSVLMAGASEFFEALLVAEASPSTTVRKGGVEQGLEERELFVCGSLTDSAVQFVNTARRHGTPVFALPDTLVRGTQADAAAEAELIERVANGLQSHPRVILVTASTVELDPARSQVITEALTRLACAVVREAGVTHVRVEGGATAACLLKQLGWGRLEVIREVAPGVVTLAAGGGRRPFMTMKPGSYVWPDTIQRPLKQGVSMN